MGWREVVQFQQSQPAPAKQACRRISLYSKQTLDAWGEESGPSLVPSQHAHGVSAVDRAICSRICHDETIARSNLQFRWLDMPRKQAAADSYSPRPVSPFYRFDWNYALKVGRSSAIQRAGQIIVSTPVIAQLSPLLNFHSPQVILLWVASASFIAGAGVLWGRAPFFLQENDGFKTFKDRDNAHRWILWQFRQNVSVFPRPEHAMAETIDKGLSYKADDLTDRMDICCAVPCMPAPANRNLRVFDPVNINNDLYLGFHYHGIRYVLPIQEGDPNVAKREKELFWITYSELASARPISRFLVWGLFVASALCFIGALGVILYHIWTALPDRTPNYV